MRPSGTLLLNPRQVGQMGTYVANIASVDKIDDHTIAINTKMPGSVNITRLPRAVTATRLVQDRVDRVEVAIKDDQGRLLPEATPLVSIVKDGGYVADMFGDDPAAEADLGS